MSTKDLGIPFDIHGGGMDLKFPHHESEICQSMAAYGQKPINYWLHNNMVTLNGQKMSKFKGNFITLEEMFTGNHELLIQSYSPMVVRFFILQAHYGSTIDFSNESLLAAVSGLKKLENSFTKLDSIISDPNQEIDQDLNEEMSVAIDKCHAAINDDFNTAKLIAAMFELSKIINKLSDVRTKSIINLKTLERLSSDYKTFMRDILGLTDNSDTSDKVSDTMEILIELRRQAKVEKNYTYSDLIRDKLEEIGIQLYDEKDGSIAYTIK